MAGNALDTATAGSSTGSGARDGARTDGAAA
jgi:hypothetical protein